MSNIMRQLRSRVIEMKSMSDHDLVLEIQNMMSGVEWTPDTLDEIAGLLEAAGYEIEELR